MRVTTTGIARSDAGFEFTFEGRPVRAHAGESLAAALIAGGHWSFRDGRSGTARGMFCGMGVCGECQVRIDGVSRRACLESARAGIVVTRHGAVAPVHPQESRPEELRAAAASNWQELRADVLIVGAGPAGLAAARVAAEGGLDVLVVDERGKAGGQFFKQPGEGFSVEENKLDAQYVEGRQLYAQAKAAGARFMFGATVWGAFGPEAVAVAVNGQTHLVRAKRVVLATGAYERAVPIPGWTLPGYITTGAAQTLLRASQVSPGQRVLIAGNGPLNLQVAGELSAAGVKVVAVAELASGAMGSPMAALQMAMASPSLLLSGIRQVWSLRSAGVPVLHRHALVAVEGENRVERAVLARLDANSQPIETSKRTFEVDAVCVNHGFVPQSELARALGCDFEFDVPSQSWSARRGDDGRSSVPGVFLAGDVGGLQGARCAIAQGALCAATLIRELAPSAPMPAQVSRWRAELQRQRRFQRALWTTFSAAPLSTQLAQPLTLICRCEEVARASVERDLGDFAGNFSVIKRATRVGMGRCQGRYCGSTLAALMHERFGSAPRASEYFAPRAPAKPVTLVQLAGETGEETTPIDVLRTTGRDANICS